MRLDHVSYVTSHEQISDTVQRIGSQIGTAFVDGGIHPRFGTRNFTAPLLNGKYIEVVCALDHPAAEQSAFGKAVSRKAMEGGGWLTWVFAVDHIAELESRIGRPSIEGHRKRPDGVDLKWKQVGVKDIIDEPRLPFFIEWLTADHPSADGRPVSSLERINFNGNAEAGATLLAGNGVSHSGVDVELTWSGLDGEDYPQGIQSITIKGPDGSVEIF